MHFTPAPERPWKQTRHPRPTHTHAPDDRRPGRAQHSSSLAVVSWLLHTLFPPSSSGRCPSCWPPCTLATLPRVTRLSSTPGAPPPRGLLSVQPDPQGPGQTVTLTCQFTLCLLHPGQVSALQWGSCLLSHSSWHGQQSNPFAE